MKLVLNAKSYKVVLPKQVVENVLKWKHGDELVAEYDKDSVCIRKKEVDND